MGAGEPAYWSADTLVGRLQGAGAPEHLCTAAAAPQCRALLPLAVCCGSEVVVAALVAAGAAEQQAGAAFQQLESLAKRQAGALQPDAAATAVPAVVQHCAAALLAAGKADIQAHAVAVRLAFPHNKPPQPGAAADGSSTPPCPWLLQQLLQRHQVGQLPVAAAAVGAVCEALVQCAQQCTKQDSQERRKLGSSLAAWLRLPAAGELAGSKLAALLEQACQAGLTKGLPALLALAAVQAELRAEAQAPLVVVGPPGGADCPAALVCAATFSGSATVLDSVLAAGGAVTLNTIHQAVAAAACSERSQKRSLRALQQLLRRGRPPVPTDVAALGSLPGGARLTELCYRLCPIYNLLFMVSCHMDGVRTWGAVGLPQRVVPSQGSGLWGSPVRRCD